MSTDPAATESSTTESSTTGPSTTGPAVGTPDWPQPVGKPPAAHWWSIQRPPPSEPISARRAYGEVLGVFAAFFAVGILAGAETLAHRFRVAPGSWAVFGPAALSEVATASLAVLVTVLLSARRGITARSLGFGLPRNSRGGTAVWPAFRIGVWALAAMIVGGAITGLLASGKLGQPVRQDYSYQLYATAASLAAGVVEETVVLAFVVTTLRQARRPLVEIVIVAVLLRCSYHDYYGPGVAGIAIWAAVFVWLYLRSGSVIPLVVVHFLWDATIFLSQRWHWINTVRGVAALALLIAAVISWLDDVSKRGRAPRPGGRSAAMYTAWPFPEPQPPQLPEQHSSAGDQGQLHR